MTMGWCLLFGGEYYYWALTDNMGLTGHGSEMIAKMVMAFIDSLLVVAFVFVISGVVDYFKLESEASETAVEKLVEGASLLLGLAWEATFDVAAEGFMDKF